MAPTGVESDSAPNETKFGQIRSNLVLVSSKKRFDGLSRAKNRLPVVTFYQVRKAEGVLVPSGAASNSASNETKFGRFGKELREL